MDILVCIFKYNYVMLCLRGNVYPNVFLCACVRAYTIHTHTHTNTHTHARTHARTHTHTTERKHRHTQLYKHANTVPKIKYVNIYYVINSLNKIR